MRKPAFRICKNKGTDQLRGNCAADEADERLSFRYIDTCSDIDTFSAIHLLPKSKISHLLWLYSPVCVGPGWKRQRQVFLRRGSHVCSPSLILL